MKKLLFSFILGLSFCSINAQGPYLSSNINLVGFINPETVAGTDAIKYSGCWGYQQTSKSKEYAIVGSSTGTYFIDITAPATPTVCDYVKGKQPSPCIWREVNVYQNYAYVVSDDPSPNSFQIIDMQYLPDSVHVVYDGKSFFERAHTVTVDGNKLYVAGMTFSNSATSALRVYSLATPSVPVLLRSLAQDYPSISYVHDMFVRNDTVFASCGNQGLHVYKFTASNTFSALGQFTGYTEAGYSHSSSITKDGKHLVFCDEVPTNLSIKIADISNLTNITLTSMFRPNMNNGFVGHNPYVIGDYALISCYEDGVNLYNITNPSAPVLAGYFDTYPQGGASFGNNYGTGSYNGNWGAFPYYKSGYILACDMQNGIFILEAFSLLGNPTVIKEVSSNSNIIANVFPNPASTNLTVSIKDNSTEPYVIGIRNMQGQLIIKETETNGSANQFISKKINIASLSEGMYSVSITSGKNSFHKKVVVSR